MQKFKRLLLIVVLATNIARSADINVYTDRQEIFLRPLISAYEQQSGDKINILFIKKGMLQRLQAEGDSSPADLFLATDIGRLLDLVDAGLTAPLHDAHINRVLAATLRGDHWFAITRRVRAIYAAPGATIKTYDDLAKAANVCWRSGAHPYNNALFADIIARRGAIAAKQWLLQIKNGMARLPQGKDRSQINAVANGECDIGVANSYYYFHLLHNAAAERQQLLKEKVKLIIPQDAHVNITGMALAKRAPHPAATKNFMRFLLGTKAQLLLATQNFEFPVRDDIPYPPLLRPYRRAMENIAPALLPIARHRQQAAQLTDEIGFDR